MGFERVSRSPDEDGKTLSSVRKRFAGRSSPPSGGFPSLQRRSLRRVIDVTAIHEKLTTLQHRPDIQAISQVAYGGLARGVIRMEDVVMSWLEINPYWWKEVTRAEIENGLAVEDFLDKLSTNKPED